MPGSATTSTCRARNATIACRGSTPTSRSPLADIVPGFSDLRGGLRFVGVDGNPRSQYTGDWNNIAPRVGAAYQLTPKTVMRGAVGRFFGPSTLAAQGTVGPYGFRVETPWIATLDNLTPSNLLRNPFPQGFRPVPGASDGLLTAIGGRVEAPLSDTTTPYVWQWNVTVQRELPAGLLVEAAYVGNRGRELSLGGEGGYTLNQLDPSYLSLGTALNQLVPNPFYGQVATGPLSQQTVARGQLLRPYPQFGDIIPLFYQGAQSSYDAFQLTVQPPARERLRFRRELRRLEEHGLGPELPERVRSLERQRSLGCSRAVSRRPQRDL